MRLCGRRLHNILHDLLNFLEDEISEPFNGVRRFVHNDLWAEYILIDHNTSGINGIIDWDDAAISDPAVDFSGPYSGYGRPWLEEVLSHYTLDVGSYNISRAR